MRKDILLWKIKNSRLCNWFTKVVHLKSTILLFAVAIASSSILFCHNVSAASYPINSFSLYGQKTYGAANTWQTGLGYAGTTMHSVYRWEVWTSSISSGETGKYATVNFSGIIQLPDGWSYSTLNQGYTITQCVLGNQVATLSNIQTSWAPNVNSQNVPVITYAASASLEFPSNSVSGQFYCTFQSNNGQYFVQSDGSAVSQIIFGNTGVDLTFSSTLSDELLQTQINQNNTIITQNEQTNQYLEEQQQQDQQDRDNLESQQTEVDSSAENSQEQVLGSVQEFVNGWQAIISVFGSVRPTDCNIDINTTNLNLGGVNLCSGKPSQLDPLIVVATSLGMVFLGFFWARHIVYTVVELVESFFGGFSLKRGFWS